MGNAVNAQTATGHVFNICGCTDVIGFEPSAKALINLHSIEPWDARSLVKDNLAKQGELAKRSPLRKVQVEDGLQFVKAKTQGWFQASLTRDQFVTICITLLATKEVQHTQKDRDDLYLIFDSLDFDGNGELSTGEWAAGLSVFFKGIMEIAVRAVFQTLDADNNASISKRELKAYVSPFVKAMVPPQASALRPVLESKVVNDIYSEMDMDKKGGISSDEMIMWTKKGNNLIDKLADIIDKEVYQIWLDQHHNRMDNARAGGQDPQSSAYGYSPNSRGSGPFGQEAGNVGGPGPMGQYGASRAGPGYDPGAQYGGGPMNSQYGTGPAGQGGPYANQQYPDDGQGQRSGSQAGKQGGGGWFDLGPGAGSSGTQAGKSGGGGWFGLWGGNSGDEVRQTVESGAGDYGRQSASQPHDPFSGQWNAVPPPPPPPGRGPPPPSGGAGYSGGYGVPQPPAYDNGLMSAAGSSGVHQSSAPYQSGRW
eukprot:CAMPEP_0115086704 /NCGR_PEP_ID=MMETSP0227-20121206/22761_1 /TAXON_ID=89957 /ORGANISM="Polarella glacialis, Strain CCMP 1383" /LENGTH=479 /DNA_ID=CAMNT_0002476247 /DNA_START=95 /DNA_END=1534 /DNA_ORIENTATION=+